MCKNIVIKLFVCLCLIAIPNISLGQSNTSSNVKKPVVSKLTVKQYIVKHALEIGLDPALALSIAKMESGFKHESKSCHGAVGVFQLMPNTAKNMGYNPWILSDNVKGGLGYYKSLHKKYGSTELALAAYNGGPSVVKRFSTLSENSHTKRYVRKIMAEYNMQKKYPDPVIKQVKLQKQKVVSQSKINKPQLKKQPQQVNVMTSVQQSSVVKNNNSKVSTDVNLNIKNSIVPNREVKKSNVEKNQLVKQNGEEKSISSGSLLQHDNISPACNIVKQESCSSKILEDKGKEDNKVPKSGNETMMLNNDVI